MTERRAAAVGLGALVLLALALSLRPMEEMDLFFRLARGEQILATGAVPTKNLFSFTHPEHPYPDSAWLFDAGAAALHRTGGIRALVIAKSAVAALVLVVAFLVARRRGASAAASVVAIAAAALCMQERLVERPHLFSFLGTLAIVALIDARPRLVLLAVPITALWTNLHAGSFLAPLLLGAAAIAGPSRRWLAAAAAGATVALLASPVGTGVFSYLAFHLDINTLHPVDEFRAPTWTSDAPSLLFAGAAAALLAAPAGRRPPLHHLLPVAAVAILAARSVRFAADAVLLMAPLVAVRLDALASRLRARVGAVPALAAAGAAVALAGLHLRGAGVALHPQAIPADAIRFVEQHGLDRRMYNDFELGGYLAWTGFPRRRVFVDARLPAYPRSFHALLGRADVDRAEWDAALARWGIDAALLTYAGVNRRVSWWDPAGWALVYRAQDARVFVRRTPAHGALIAAREIPATFAFTDADGNRTVPLGVPPAASPVPACEWDLRLGDLLFELDAGKPDRALAATRRALAAPDDCLRPGRAARPAAWAGALLIERGDPAAALPMLDRAAAVAPELPTLTNRALALEALGRKADARDAWLRVAAAAPRTELGTRARSRAERLDR